MKSNRRDFLKRTSFAGISLAGAGLFSSYTADNDKKSSGQKKKSGTARKQVFNMCGYAAPPMETVRTGFIGLGNRGPGHLVSMTRIQGVKVVALCDLRQDRVDAAKKRIAKSGQDPVTYSGGTEEWKKLCERNDIDLIYIATPWSMHAPMAVYAMEHGKHVCIEVPAVRTLEECWQIVETSERTRKHCMMLENCCYDFFELLTLNMARQGFFGEIVHGEGAYLHDLLEGNFSKRKYWDFWRLRENAERNGNIYPTHGLGPVCQIMDINRGDKMDFLVSVASNDFMMNEMAKQLAATDETFKPFVGRPYRGEMNTTTIRTSKGRTIMIQHDVTSPNVYSRIHKISGTKGSALKYPLPEKISIGDRWLKPDEYKETEEKYRPEIVKKIGEMAKQVGGHGGMDFIMDWRVIDCLRNGLPLDMDVYDAALWSSIGPLSEMSISNRSNSVDVPDFTGGSWKTNKQVDIKLENSGNTRVV